MASRPRRPRRLLLPAVLGAILAGEITGIAIGRALPPTVVPVAPPAVSAAAAPLVSGTTQSQVADRRDARAELVRVGVDLASRQPATITATAGRTVSAAASAKTTSVGSAPTSGTTAAGRSQSAASPRYHGANHVWIPSLGISKGIQSFPCSRTRPPDAGVYRWGCAGRNNVYLLSHAWSTFKPLHDAYVRGTLRKGMRVWYAGTDGRAHEYRVLWWRVTAPTTAASWAWAALPSPGMTLQTCVGANSEYRLMVRLDRVD